jgi:hypothetical protein
MLVKTDALGNRQWNRTYGGIAYSIVATSDGGYVMAGIIGSSSAGYDFWLIKTDALGNMEWNRTYGGTGYDVACSLVATSDGGFAIAGATWSFGVGGADYWLVKTDALGNMQWNRTYGTSGDDVACSLVATSDGGYAIAGTANGDTDIWFFIGLLNMIGYWSGGDFWLVKTDAVGNMEWSRTYGGTGSDVAWSMVAVSDGGCALAGTRNYTLSVDGEGCGDFWLVKTDAPGNMEWNQTYGGTGDDYARSLVEASNGGFAIAGAKWYFGVGFGGADYWLVKTDALGNMQWNQTYGGTGDDYAFSLVEASYGGYALAGTWDYVNYYDDVSQIPVARGDFWLVKTDENGVLPEYSSWLIPSIVLTATAFIIINKKRLLHKRSK